MAVAEVVGYFGHVGAPSFREAKGWDENGSYQRGLEDS